MANLTIAQLTDATTVTSADELPIIQAGVTKRATVAELAAAISIDAVALTVQNESTPLLAVATTLNFTGAGVTATGTGAVKTITIPGSGSGGVDVQDDSVALATTATTLNFTGTGVTASGTGATKTVAIPGDYVQNGVTPSSTTKAPSVDAVVAAIAAASNGITVQDEGASLASTATILNFVGSGVTATGTGATKTITVDVPAAGVQNNLNPSTTIAPSATAVNTGLALKADSRALVTTTSTAFSLTSTHANTRVDVSNASPITVTWNTGSGMTAGDCGRIVQTDSGSITLVSANQGLYPITAAPNVVSYVTTDIGSWVDWEYLGGDTLLISDVGVPVVAGVTVKDEANVLTTAKTTLTFTGAGVTASGTGAEVTIDIPGTSVSETTFDWPTSGVCLPAGAGTSLDQLGCEVLSTGTYVLRSPANTSVFAQARRIGIKANATTANGVSGFRPGNATYLVTGGASGWRFLITGGVSDIIASAGRFFIGMGPAGMALPTTTEASAEVNIVGVGADSTDSALYWMHNDGSGTATRTVVSGSWPANSSSVNLYQLLIVYVPSPESYTMTITNLKDATTATHTVTAAGVGNIPPANTRMGALLYRANAANLADPTLDMVVIASGKFASSYA